MWLTRVLWISYRWFISLSSLNKQLLFLLGLTLIIFFITYHLWWLIFWFELSLLPIVLIITGQGGQRARFPASLYLLVYTIIFSLPSLFILLKLRFYSLIVRGCFSSSLIKWRLVLRFLVKMPVFGLHLWLPKAHVESPTVGRAILAGILLKTGVYGIYILSFWFKIILPAMWILLGRIITSLYARVQTDLKRIIALRRVAHLNLRLAAFYTFFKIGQRTLLLIALTHGFISSTLFFLAGIRRKHRRLIFWLNQGLLIIWLLIIRFNLSLPPRPSFWTEYIRFSCLIGKHFRTLILLILGGLCLAWFSIVIWLNLKIQISSVTLPSYFLVLNFCFFVILLWLNPVLFFYSISIVIYIFLSKIRNKLFKKVRFWSA